MRHLLAVVLVSASLATSGCTLVGTALGAATPRYERTDWPHSTVELGTAVRARVRTIGADSFTSTEVSGRYGGVRDGLLSITDDEGRRHELAVRDIVDLEVRDGTHWVKGLLFGAAVDTIVVVAVAVAAGGGNISVATGQ